MEHQIIAIVNQLIQNGKKPTVALVRAKLTSHVAMPILLRTLHKVESLTPAQISALVDDSSQSTPKSSQATPNEISVLNAKVDQLQDQVTQLQQQLNDITTQLGLNSQ